MATWKKTLSQNQPIFNSTIKWIRMAGKFYRFCQLTSVKGVPRLLRTESVIMQFIWTISVIVLLCLALLQTTFLTMEYLHYKTYTFTGEANIYNLRHEDGTTGVPDITLCNANPFASDRNLSKDVPTMAKYFELVEQSTTCGNDCKEDEILALKHIRNDMINAESYFNYIGRHTAEKLGHTFESFFAYCEVDMPRSGYGMLRHVPCLSTEIIQIQHTTHYNCYTIRAHQNDVPDKVLPGFLVVLHLDEYGAIDNEQSMLNPHKIPGHISGVWIFAHQQNKPLYDNYQRMLLQPGHFHDIPVNVVQRTYLPPPHGHCENMDGQEYSLTLCHNQCIRAYVYEKCGCLELVNYTSPWRPIENEGPPCFSVSLKKNDLIRNWNCVMEETRKRLDECEASCPEPCSDMRYKLRVRVYDWFNLI